MHISVSINYNCGVLRVPWGCFLKCSNDQFVKFVNMRHEYGITCLIAAVDGNHIEIVKRLLCIKEIDVNKGDEDEMNPLHYACLRGYLKIARVNSFSFHLIEPIWNSYSLITVAREEIFAL